MVIQISCTRTEFVQGASLTAKRRQQNVPPLVTYCECCSRASHLRPSTSLPPVAGVALFSSSWRKADHRETQVGHGVQRCRGTVCPRLLQLQKRTMVWLQLMPTCLIPIKCDSFISMKFVKATSLMQRLLSALLQLLVSLCIYVVRFVPD